MNKLKLGIGLSLIWIISCAVRFNQPVINKVFVPCQIVPQSMLISWWNGNHLTSNGIEDLAGVNLAQPRNLSVVSGQSGNALKFQSSGSAAIVSAFQGLENTSSFSVVAYLKGSGPF